MCERERASKRGREREKERKKNKKREDGKEYAGGESLKVYIFLYKL